MYDYITLQANFHYLVEDRFGCEEKIQDYAKRSGIEEATRLIHAANGCNKISKDYRYKIDNIQYHTCFCRFKHPKMGFFIHLFNQYEKGILPFEGSLLDQPSYIIDIFSLISKLKNEKEEADRKREEINGRRKHRHRTGNQGVQSSSEGSRGQR